MSKRFNPPPNWPPPPTPKWQPGPDWQPDPRWGPPPPGWKLWVRVNPFLRGFLIGLATVAVVTVLAGLRFGYYGTDVTAAYMVGGIMVAAPGAALLGLISSFRWHWWLYAITVVFLTAMAGEYSLAQQGY